MEGIVVIGILLVVVVLVAAVAYGIFIAKITNSTGWGIFNGFMVVLWAALQLFNEFNRTGRGRRW